MVFHQGFGHSALVEKRVNFAQVRVVKLFVSGEVLPELQLFLGKEVLVLAAFLEQLCFAEVLVGQGQVGGHLGEVFIVSFEVEIDLPHVLPRQVLESADDVLLDL